MGIGYLVDRQFETAPWGLLVGLVCGFGSFVLRLLRLARQFERLAESEAADSRESDATDE